MLAFTLGVSILSVFVFAMAPLMQMRERDLATWLSGSGQRTSGGGGSHRLRTTLVIAEIALAVVPLIGSGLMLRAFWKLRQVDVGFEPRGVTSFSLQLPASRYQNPDRLRFASQLEERLASLPGVKSASFASGLPPLRPINANDTDIEDYQGTPDGPAENVDYWNIVDEDYFNTMGIRTIEGRTLRLVGSQRQRAKSRGYQSGDGATLLARQPDWPACESRVQHPGRCGSRLSASSKTRRTSAWISPREPNSISFCRRRSLSESALRMSFVVRTEGASAAAIASSIRSSGQRA